MMEPLNLPMAPLKLKKRSDKLFVWCILRKKELVLTPEEWVRQHLIHFFISHRSLPHGLIAAEMSIIVNDLQRRCDLVIYDKSGRPVMIVECKAPGINLDDKVFRQIAQYNFKLGVNLLMMSNGKEHVIAKIDRKDGSIIYLNDLPEELNL